MDFRRMLLIHTLQTWHTHTQWAQSQAWVSAQVLPTHIMMFRCDLRLITEELCDRAGTTFFSHKQAGEVLKKAFSPRQQRDNEGCLRKSSAQLALRESGIYSHHRNIRTADKASSSSSAKLVFTRQLCIRCVWLTSRCPCSTCVVNRVAQDINVNNSHITGTLVLSVM